MLRQSLLLSLLFAGLISGPAMGQAVIQDVTDRPMPPPPPPPSPFQRGSGESWVYLQSEPNAAKLLWIPPRWPENQKGYFVKRREPGRRWSTLNGVTLQPTLYKEDMDLRTNSPELRKELRALLASVQNQIADKIRPLEEVLQQLSTQQGFGYRRGAIRAKYSQALLFGFGYQDSKIPKGDVFEYGLFTMSTDGTESAEPIAIRRWERNNPSIPTMRFGDPVVSVKDGGPVMVTWPMPRSHAEVNLLRRVLIYVVDPQGTRSKLLEQEGGTVEVNSKAEVAVSHLREPGVYSLQAVAVNYFGVEAEPSPTATYEFEKYKDQLRPPERPKPTTTTPPPPSPVRPAPRN